MITTMVIKMDKEDYIKKYILNGGQMFSIDKIAAYRDGGTLWLITSVKDVHLYIHKDNWTFHDGYPATEENIITDYLYKVYITDRLEKYKSHCEFELGRSIRILNELNDHDILKND